MNYPKKFLVFILFILACTNIVFAQYYENNAKSGLGIPYFDVVFHNKFDQNMDGYDVLVITQFLYDDLTFTKSDTSGYEASFELLIAAYDEKENVVFNRTINKKIHVASFNQTNTRDKKVLLKNDINLKSGKYTILLKALDLSTNQSTSRKTTLMLKDYMSDALFISGISFLQDVVWDSSMQVVSFNPTIGSNFSARNGAFYVYFDLYTRNLDVPVQV
ncbi:MAG: hypothetical protein P8X42_02455 [Calditrichaceae bacterium]